MINIIQNSPVSGLIVSSLTARPVTMESAVASAAGTTVSDSPKMSILSRQLSESATRSALRDDSLTYRQLGELRKKLIDDFSSERYYSNKARHDSEVPNVDDVELRARAVAATEYVNGAALGDKTVKNPFAGLQREQLDLIVYDDSGLYTVNERFAASYRSDQLEQVWCKKVSAMIMDEYSRTGNTKTPKILTEMLSHYRTLPRIEQTQFPDGYAADLESKIGSGAPN